MPSIKVLDRQDGQWKYIDAKALKEDGFLDRYDLDPNDEVPVEGIGGYKNAYVPADDYVRLQEQGTQVRSANLGEMEGAELEKRKEETYSTAGTYLAETGRSVLFELPSLFDDQLDIANRESRRETHPTAAVLGEVTGVVGPAIATLGSSLGASAAGAGAKAGAKLAGKTIAKEAAKEATEEASKSLLRKVGAGVTTAAAATPAGLSTLAGEALGGAIVGGARAAGAGNLGLRAAKVAGLSAAGAVEGALYGVGQGIEAISESDVDLAGEGLIASTIVDSALENAAVGAVAGAAFGTVVPSLGAVGSSAGSAAKRAASPVVVKSRQVLSDLADKVGGIPIVGDMLVSKTSKQIPKVIDNFKTGWQKSNKITREYVSSLTDLKSDLLKKDANLHKQLNIDFNKLAKGVGGPSDQLTLNLGDAAVRSGDLTTEELKRTAYVAGPNSAFAQVTDALHSVADAHSKHLSATSDLKDALGVTNITEITEDTIARIAEFDSKKSKDLLETFSKHREAQVEVVQQFNALIPKIGKEAPELLEKYQDTLKPLKLSEVDDAVPNVRASVERLLEAGKETQSGSFTTVAATIGLLDILGVDIDTMLGLPPWAFDLLIPATVKKFRQSVLRSKLGMRRGGVSKTLAKTKDGTQKAGSFVLESTSKKSLGAPSTLAIYNAYNDSRERDRVRLNDEYSAAKTAKKNRLPAEVRAYKKAAERIVGLKNNQEQSSASIFNLMIGEREDVVNAAIKTHQRKIDFLYEKLPKTVNPRNALTYDEIGTPSAREVKKFARYLFAANDPETVLKQIASGKFTDEAVETLQVVYPSMFRDVQFHILNNIAEMDKNLPRQKRIRLSRVFEIPIEPTMRANLTLTLQAGYAGEQQKIEQQKQVSAPTSKSIREFEPPGSIPTASDDLLKTKIGE